MNKRTKWISIWAAVIIVDLFIACTSVELLVRWLVPVENVRYVWDDKIGVRFAPNQQTCGYVEKGYRNILLTNSFGMHDIERNLNKSVTSFRVQVYGGSIVSGIGVGIEETIPSYLERFMNEQKRREHIEVINMASGAEGTPSELFTYEEIGKGFKPDLVVCLFADDFAANIIETDKRDESPHFDMDDAGKLRLIPPRPRDQSNWERFRKGSFLYRQLANRFLESKTNRDVLAFVSNVTHGVSNSGLNNHAEYTKEVCLGKALPVTLELIKRFRDVVEKDGARFVVMDGCKFSGKYVGTVFRNNDFEQFCRTNSIGYIPAYKRKMELDGSPEYHLKSQQPNSAGNREIARFTAAWLAELISTCGPVGLNQTGETELDGNGKRTETAHTAIN